MNEPCRLCGSEPEVATYYDFYRFNCPTEGCGESLDNGKVVNGISMWYGSIAEARDAWNLRQRREETQSATQTTEPEPKPAREGDEPKIGEIAWHREVLDGHHPSDCPYCGCERVVIGEYEPCHDDAWDYYIEHKNPREAIERRCFEMYAAFKTPEDAVRGADMRAPEWAIPVNEDTMRVLSDVCREKPKKQLRAEAVERLKHNCAASYSPRAIVTSLAGGRYGMDDWTLERNAIIDLLTDDEQEASRHSKAGGSHSKDAQVFSDVVSDETTGNTESYNLGGVSGGETIGNADSYNLDTREQLEEDIRKRTECSWVTVPHEKVIEWLDRQAAITECKFWECYANGNQWEIYQLEKKCDELTAERDYLKKVVQTQAESFRKIEQELKEAKTINGQTEEAGDHGR